MNKTLKNALTAAALGTAALLSVSVPALASAQPSLAAAQPAHVAYAGHVAHVTAESATYHGFRAMESGCCA